MPLGNDLVVEKFFSTWFKVSDIGALEIVAECCTKFEPSSGSTCRLEYSKYLKYSSAGFCDQVLEILLEHSKSS